MNSNPPILPGCRVLPPMEVDAEPQAATPKWTATKGKAGDRFAVLNGFVDVTMGTLCRGDIAVWLVLYRDERDGISKTSQADISTRAGLSVRGVKAALRRLRQRGLVKQVFRGGINRGPSRYRVLPLAH